LERLRFGFDTDVCWQLLEGVTWKEAIESVSWGGLSDCIFYMDTDSLVYYLPLFMHMLFADPDDYNGQAGNDTDAVAFVLALRETYERLVSRLNEDQVEVLKDAIAHFICAEMMYSGPEYCLRYRGTLIARWFGQEAEDE
jgi:hypothetical protein